MRKTDFPRKQLRDNGNPEGEDEHDVGETDLVGVGQLIGLAADFVDVEAEREYDGGKAEQHHRRESHPTRVRYNVAVPVAGRQQNDRCCDANAPDEDADQGQQPFRLEFGGEAHLRPIVKRHAGPHQS